MEFIYQKINRIIPKEYNSSEISAPEEKKKGVPRKRKGCSEKKVERKKMRGRRDAAHRGEKKDNSVYF